VIKRRLIDANIISRFLTNDGSEKAAACESLLFKLEYYTFVIRVWIQRYTMYIKTNKEILQIMST